MGARCPGIRVGVVARWRVPPLLLTQTNQSNQTKLTKRWKGYLNWAVGRLAAELLHWFRMPLADAARCALSCRGWLPVDHAWVPMPVPRLLASCGWPWCLTEDNGRSVLRGAPEKVADAARRAREREKSLCGTPGGGRNCGSVAGRGDRRFHGSRTRAHTVTLTQSLSHSRHGL